MAVPAIGNRLTAKVDLTVFTDRECTKQYPPLPPGPNGLRKSMQYPGTRKTGEEVGAYTGNSSEQGFEVDFSLTYSVAIKKTFIGWDYQTIIKPVKVWVKRTQVTGFWDDSVDAPKAPAPDKDKNPPPADNTNLFLGAAVAVAAFLKFRKPTN